VICKARNLSVILYRQTCVYRPQVPSLTFIFGATLTWWIYSMVYFAGREWHSSLQFWL